MTVDELIKALEDQSWKLKIEIDNLVLQIKYRQQVIDAPVPLFRRPAGPVWKYKDILREIQYSAKDKLRRLRSKAKALQNKIKKAKAKKEKAEKAKAEKAKK